MLKHNLPIQLHNGIWVKREDLCAVTGAPPFSKFRGVVAHLSKRPEKRIGVLDTLHSKAGWAVAYACRELGKTCINYWPRYKAEPKGVLRPYQKRAQELGALMVELPAGRSAILYHQAKRALLLSPGYMMPNALKLQESVEETAREYLASRFAHSADVVVVSASSGTIAGGVMLGALWANPLGPYPKFVIHLGYSRPRDAVMRYLLKLAPAFPPSHIQIVDEGYQYSEAVEEPVPFPCNPYYDLKAWKWAMRQRWPQTQKVLFWNIGA